MNTLPRFDTPDVFNQSPPYENIDLFSSDVPLQEAMRANGAGGEVAALADFGQQWGTAEMFALARRANENTPKLYTFDPKGFRRDVVEFHPAYHDLMRASVAAGLHCSTWTPSGARAAPPAEVARSARYYMAAQIESGHLCPITMTRAALAALAPDPALLANVAAKVVTRSYDPVFRSWWEKPGITLGMGMTEKQGGTDVRANITTATPSGDFYAIDGHKWFLSAPMCDAFLVLAQAQGGLTCFFVPRFRPDGSVNALRLRAAQGQARQPLQCLERSRVRRRLRATGRRRGRGRAHHHPDGAADAARLRVGFGRLHAHGAGAGGASLPLPLSVSAASLRSADDARGTVRSGAGSGRRSGVGHAAVARLRPGRRPIRDEAAYARLVTPAAKYWICKTAPSFIYEAMECLGGNGYVEESVLPRLYREAPVNAIWEGSGNVMCLDVLRALRRDPEAAEFFGELARRGLSAHRRGTGHLGANE